MYVETSDDLNRKYSQSFALLDDELIFFVDFWKDKNEQIVAHVQLEDGSEKEININSNIVPLNIDSMYVNNAELGQKTPKGAWPIAATLFRKSGRRQWRCGISTENSIISCPLTLLYSSLGKNLGHFHWHPSFPLIHRLLDPVYPTYDEAINFVKQHQAVAISPMFALCLSSISKDKFLIASRCGFIGEGTKGCIWIHHIPSQQEIMDYIKRTQQDILIEVLA